MFAEMKAVLLQNCKRSARALRPEHALKWRPLTVLRQLVRLILGQLKWEGGRYYSGRYDEPQTRPQHDVASNLVFSASASQVRHVFVAGKHALNNYQLEGSRNLKYEKSRQRC